METDTLHSTPQEDTITFTPQPLLVPSRPPLDPNIPSLEPLLGGFLTCERCRKAYPQGTDCCTEVVRFDGHGRTKEQYRETPKVHQGLSGYIPQRAAQDKVHQTSLRPVWWSHRRQHLLLNFQDPVHKAKTDVRDTTTLYQFSFKFFSGLRD